MDLPLSLLFSPKLRHFLAVYRFRNLRNAAREIGISQPALSKSLRTLEQELDVMLFLRSKTGMVPTEAGDALSRYVARLSDLAREAEVEITAIRGNDGGSIRIGAGQMWSWLFVPMIVARFTADFPNTSIEVTTGPMRELMPRLKEGELDIIIGDFDGIHVPEGFQMQHAWSADFCAFSSIDHPLADRPSTTPADLVEFPWCGYIDHDVFEHHVRFWCRRVNLKPPHISIKASSLATLLRLASTSQNIAILPSELEAEAERWGLVRLGVKAIELWNVRTGSIVHERKATIKQFAHLLALIQGVGENPSEHLTTSI